MKRRRMVINYGAATARPDAGVSSILAADKRQGTINARESEMPRRGRGDHSQKVYETAKR
jgi:hypothetical protein